MSVETEPIKLRPFEISPDGRGGAVLIRPGGLSLKVSSDILPFFQMCSGGCSIADLAARSGIGSKQAWGRFARLARFIGLLYEGDLLIDPRLKRLAEALRPDYVWRESIALEELFSLEIMRLKGGHALPRAASWPIFAAIAVSVSFFLVRFPWSFRVLTEGWPKLETAWPAIAAFVLTFTIGRSLRAFLQFIVIRTMAGGGAALRLRLDALSLAFATDDASKAQMNGLCVGASILALFSLMAPAGAGSLFANAGLLANISPFLPFFTMLLLLVDLSPFRKSALTECLRAVYVYLDRRERSGLAESTIRHLQIFACVLWVTLFGLFLAGPMVRFVFYVKDAELASTFPGKISLAALGGIILLAVVSLLDDIVSGIGDGGGNDRHSIRRLWRRRETLERAAGLLEERSPERADLESLPFLRQMDPASRDLLLNNANVIACGAGGSVCRQGDADRTLYILLAGRLAVARRNSSGRRKTVAYLEPGSVFGEIAFFIGDRRTADVIAIESSRLLAIRHDERLSRLDRARSDDLRLRIWFLQALVGSSLFKNLPADALDALLFAGQKREFRAGSKIISEGEAGDACYFIIQGQASVVQNFVPINRLKSGDAFGEIALLNPALLRTASVVADSDLLTVYIEARRFGDLLCRHLPLALEIEKLAEARLLGDAARSSS